MKISAVLICALMMAVSAMGQEGGGVRRGAMDATTRNLSHHTKEPTPYPTKAPSKYPTKAPTKYEPTKTPTYAPTIPKVEPTKIPVTDAPTVEPTAEVSDGGTPVPTHERESSCCIV